MRYGIVSDVHSNLVALTAVLAELDAWGMQSLLCLGDIVGYGADPNECCEALRERNAVSIAGNHDEAAISTEGGMFFNAAAREALEWTQERLTPSNRAWLASLPRERHIGTIALVHGAPVHHFDYILDEPDARDAFARSADRVTLVGHSHVAEAYVLDEATKAIRRRSLQDGGVVELAEGFRHIVNPGSVGQPRDGNPRASYAMLDDAAATIAIRRASYDVDAARRRIENEHLPAYLGARLAVGH